MPRARSPGANSAAAGPAAGWPLAAMLPLLEVERAEESRQRGDRIEEAPGPRGRQLYFGGFFGAAGLVPSQRTEMLKVKGRVSEPRVTVPS